jgi:hypothetical protein
MYTDFKKVLISENLVSNWSDGKFREYVYSLVRPYRLSGIKCREIPDTIQTLVNRVTEAINSGAYIVSTSDVDYAYKQIKYLIDYKDVEQGGCNRTKKKAAAHAILNSEKPSWVAIAQSNSEICPAKEKRASANCFTSIDYIVPENANGKVTNTNRIRVVIPKNSLNIKVGDSIALVNTPYKTENLIVKQVNVPQNSCEDVYWFAVDTKFIDTGEVSKTGSGLPVNYPKSGFVVKTLECPEKVRELNLNKGGGSNQQNKSYSQDNNANNTQRQTEEGGRKLWIWVIVMILLSVSIFGYFKFIKK